MLVFIGNLSEQTNEEDLMEIIDPVLSNSLFSKLFDAPRVLVDIALVNLFHFEKRLLQTHAVVNFADDDVAKHVIDELQGKTLKGKPIHIRGYKQRSAKNERRRSSMYANPRHVELRRGERRNQMKQVNIIEHIEIAAPPPIKRDDKSI
jgi:RNA recognition motif-containing protein